MCVDYRKLAGLTMEEAEETEIVVKNDTLIQNVIVHHKSAVYRKPLQNQVFFFFYVKQGLTSQMPNMYIKMYVLVTMKYFLY